mgnify:CR=1 FL=1
MAIDMNALRAKAMQKKAEKPPEFIPIDLNEGNVQAIFNRCLTKSDNAPYLISDIFSPLLGYEVGNARLFDKEAIVKAKQSICYLFGQLAGVHEGKKRLTKSDCLMSYCHTRWTENEKVLLELLYMGGCKKIDAILPFSKKEGDSTIVDENIAPTLSPKDPNFPAWWEAHKVEWED